MDKLLDILTEIEAEVEWSVYDGNDNEKIMGLIHQAMDIAVRGKAHKWPEEKPEWEGKYLVRLDNGWRVYHELVRWNVDLWRSEDKDMSEFVTHWWELPEVE